MKYENTFQINLILKDKIRKKKSKDQKNEPNHKGLGQTQCT